MTGLEVAEIPVVPDAGGGQGLAIETRRLTKRYGTLFAVRDLDLHVPQGAVFGLIGPNGAGKTTTMSILASLLKPTAGSALVAGFDPTSQTREVRRRVGYMPDVVGVYDNLRVDEYLEFFAGAYRIPRASWPSLIDSLLELVDLTGKRSAMVNDLSRGMKQRLSLARALVHDPEVLILDEPASGLDPRARIDLRVLLGELQAMGKTILVSSHILAELQEICSHIAIMEAGHLLASGAPQTILDQLGHGRTVKVRLAGGEEDLHGRRRRRAGRPPPPSDRGGTAGGRVRPERRWARGAVPRHHSGSRPVTVAMNPVFGRELKERFRGVRGWVMLIAYLVVLAGVLFLAYQATASASTDPFSGVDPTRIATVGRVIFETLVIFMLLLVLFLVPAMTSGAVAGERERQTLVPLQVTLLRPLGIVLGKVGASLAFTALLVVTSLPFLAITYLVGGVTIANVVAAVVSVVFVGIVTACLGVACSAIFRRVQAATVIAYAVVLALAAGTFVAYGAWMLIDSARGTDPLSRAPAELLVLNPFTLTADLITTEESADDGPLSALDRLIVQSRARGDLSEEFIRGEGVVVDGAGPIALDDVAQPVGECDDEPIGFDRFGNPICADAVDSLVPFWAESAVALYLLAMAGVFLGVRRLRTPAAVER